MVTAILIVVAVILVVALTAVFTALTLWRLYRRKLDHVVEEREEFLAYPQTSPEIYAWLPYHRETPASDAHAAAEAPAQGEAPATGDEI